MKKINKLTIIISLILFILSLTLIVFINISVLESNKYDNEFASISFNEEITTKEYTFDEFHCLYFFNDRDSLTEFTKRNEFLNLVPKLRIINSEEYKVSITSNSDAFEKIKIGLSGDKSCYGDGKTLIITFIDECYIPVHIDNASYDYDTGLYISMDKLEITVFAPIYNLRSNTGGINIDFEAPQCSDMIIDIRDTEGSIRNIVSNNFNLDCSGNSNLKLSGEVKENGKLFIMHNTKIDANDLKIENKKFDVTSAILINNLSYVKYNNIFHIQLYSFYSILKLVLYLAPVLWLCLFIISCCKKKSYKIK